MGSNRSLTKEEIAERTRERNRRLAEIRGERRRFAEGLAMDLSALIVDKVIRPGPKPEERRCTDVANEMTLLEPDLVDIIYNQLKKRDNRE